jgi:ATP-dependent protease ClpP protease subunit
VAGKTELLLLEGGEWALLTGAVLVVLLSLFLAYQYFVARRNRKAAVAYEERQLQTYEQAERDYDAARKALRELPHAPMIVDLIHDITDDRSAGGAAFRIEFGEATKILDQIAAAKENQPIEIVLHTLGGYSLAAELIAAAMKARKGPTKAYVPYIAMSGGTMVALSADFIAMGKNAALGPIDTQYYGYSGDSFRRLRQEKTLDKISDQVLLSSYEVEKYEAKAKEKACAIIDDNHKPNGKDDCRVVDELMSNRPHSERIDFETARSIKVKVLDGCPPDVYKLVNARLQMIKRFGDHRRPAT